ncbi:MAG: 30S ribosomal protein S4 [Candidatus Andersenbacteria bacterium]|nr:30S ribosomal protein S4 [bacterium]MDZ4225831.1 30S ribosomal protein S4 [Candidatus Andersenbacteria bacterium]
MVETTTTQAKQGSRGGMRPPQRRRPHSRYGQQMEEKQNLKKIYGIREQQLKKYFVTAHQSTVETGPGLIEILEKRLDNAVYRAGWSPTRAAARQLVSHRLVTVNGRPVDVPSLQVKVGDVISIKESKRKKAIFTNFTKSLQNVAAPSWILLDPENFSFKVTGLPGADEAGLGVDIRAIVEYFAR